jgi:hypothetical protein
VTVKTSLLQDQLLFDAEETVRKHGPAHCLAHLQEEARQLNLEASHGRVKSDWIEPETLFWAAWKVLPEGEKSAIAREVVSGFRELVEEAAAADPRPEFRADPMEWHRHRIHPVLWEVLEKNKNSMKPSDPVRKELEAWQEKKDEYLARRPVFSPVGDAPPWDE